MMMMASLDMDMIMIDGGYLRLGNVWAAGLPQQWSVAHRRGTSPKGGAERQRCLSQSKMLQNVEWRKGHFAESNSEISYASIKVVLNTKAAKVFHLMYRFNSKPTLQRWVKEKGEETPLVTVLLESCRDVLQKHRCIRYSLLTLEHKYEFHFQPDAFMSIFTPVVTWGQQVAYRSSGGGWRRQENCLSPTQGKSACE